MKAWILYGSEMLRSKLWQIIVGESDTYAILGQAFYFIATSSLASSRIVGEGSKALLHCVGD